MMCFQKEGGQKQAECYKNNVGYEGQCERCVERVCYIGETSKPAYTRVKQHLNNYKAAARLAARPNPRPGSREKESRGDVKSWMWEHTRDIHSGVVGPNNGMGDYKMKVTRKFKRCLERQVTEGVSITECEQSGGKLLNSKNEYFTPKNIETIVKQW